MKILNIYGSMNGNTEKVAKEIEKTCLESGHSVDTINAATEEKTVELLDYDLCIMGSGVYTWLPGKKVLKWIERQLEHARVSGLILPCSPKLPGKFACIYATYAGPHTGIGEAIPAVKYMGQLFDHLGITIADEWYVPGEFVPKSHQSFNTNGRLGNIQGRPNANDLKEISGKTQGLLKSISQSVTAARSQVD